MSDQPLSITFWTLFHSLLRSDKDGEAEKTRAREACSWMTGELQALRRYCDEQETDLLGLVYSHWSKHHEAPSYKLLKHNLTQESNPVLEEHLKDYEDQRASLPRLHAIDLPAHFTTKISEFSQARLAKVLSNATIINLVGGKIPVLRGKKGEKVFVKGPEESINYLVSRLDSGLMAEAPTTQTHGTLREDAHTIIENYEKRTDPNNAASKRILTGLSNYDKEIYLRRGNFVGLLGYGGHGKTRMGRTMVYNSILAGNNCMHFTFEQLFNEEMEAYGAIHSHHPQWGQTREGKSRGVLLTDITRGTLSAADKNFLYKEVIPDLMEGRTIPGTLVLRQPTDGTTWEACKTLITLTDRQYPLDMVFMDYLAQVSVEDRDRNAAICNVIEDAKLFSMTFRGGEGLLFVTPVQANKEGWKAACKEHGQYDASSIEMFTQYNRSLDVLLSVFQDDDLSNCSRVVLGSVKNRRGRNIPCFEAAVLNECGLFRDYSGAVSEATIDEAMDDL